MRPQHLRLNRAPGQSFSMRRDLAGVNGRLHLHPELELVHFQQGQGTQFVGDHIKRFGPGDVVLLGAGLPHYWRFDVTGADVRGMDVQAGHVRREDVRAADVRVADVRVVHFREDFCGKGFLELPETAALRNLFGRARRGLQVGGDARSTVAAILERMLKATGMQRLLLLQEALFALAASPQLQDLASVGFGREAKDCEDQRMDKIYDYSLRHFRRTITLEEIAALANMSPQAFCRWFKSSTNETYSRFLIGIRVGQACKLLIENNLSIKQICYDSGFHNFTGFYKYFKLVTGRSPLSYQNEWHAVGAEEKKSISSVRKLLI